MGSFLLTIIVATLVGLVFLKLKIPGAMMVGSIISVSILNISTGIAYMPAEGKIAAQIIAGAFIAIGLNKSDLKRLKNIYKPALVLLTGMLMLNILLGFIIHKTSDLDLVTSLMSTTPGGISEMPIISEEIGANSSVVAILQFTRLVFGVTLFPNMIYRVSKSEFFKGLEGDDDIYERTIVKNDTPSNLVLTIVIATVFGLLGNRTGIPSATLVFAMISTIIFNLITNRGSMPRLMRRIAQLLSGAYIGTGISMVEVKQMAHLIVPAMILVFGYLIACFLIGYILHKNFRMSFAESMLAATPAGASDMALISADIGIQSADVVVLQIIRMVTVVSLFPQIIRIIVSLVG